jgi:hypothetical protein
MNPKTLSAEKEPHPAKNMRLLPKVTASAVASGILWLAIPLSAQEKPDKASGSSKGNQGAGIYFDAEASAKDVGLPIYPGARPHKEKGEDKPSAKFGLWGSTFAFKLAVVKLESADSPQKVAAFYKKALAQYGTVLDCGASSSHASDKGKGQGSKQLDCESDEPDPGNLVFKAGTKEKEHVVGIQPNGSGSSFQLVYVESPDSDKKK